MIQWVCIEQLKTHTISSSPLKCKLSVLRLQFQPPGPGRQVVPLKQTNPSTNCFSQGVLLQK